VTLPPEKQKALETYILEGLGRELGPMPVTEDTLPDMKKALLKVMREAQKEGMFETPKYKVDVKLDPDDRTMVHIKIEEDTK
jgi:hypothetical protein